MALVVRDPGRTASIFESLFQAVIVPAGNVHRGPPEMRVQLPGLCLVLVQGEPPPQRSDAHLAFAVSEGSLALFAGKLSALGIESQLSRAGPAANALYFVDYDNHLFELNSGPRMATLGAET